MGSLTTTWNKIRKVTSGFLLGRVSASTGRAELLSPAQVRSLLSVYTISQTETAISSAVTALIAAAPGALDTLDELAAALGDDANFASTVITSLAGKQATLVSGTNIKTVGGTSLLGSGNIAVGSGDVVGPSSATDNAIARFDTTTGKLVQNGLVTINDSGMIQTNNSVNGGIDFGSSYGAITMFAGGQVAFNSALGGLAGFIVGNTQGAFDGATATQVVGNLHGPYFTSVRINGGGTYADAQSAGSIYLHGGSNYGGGTNSNGGSAFLYGGAGSGSGVTGKTHLAWDGSAARGRVLVGTGTDDGSAMLQVAGAITVSGAISLAQKTIATLPSAAASNGQRYMVTDSSVQAGRIAYCFGSVWRYEDGSAV